MGGSAVTQLHQLAGLYGVLTAYRDVNGCEQFCSPEALFNILHSLGAHLETFSEVASACRVRQQATWRQILEPVAVAWDGKSPSLVIRLPESQADTRLIGHLVLETGEKRNWEWLGGALSTAETAEVEGERYIAKRLFLPESLPLGYHHFMLESPGISEGAIIISAPTSAYNPPEQLPSRPWGIFLPLYALHSQRSWGAGDFSDLAALADWLAGLGGGVVGTLPLLSAFLDKPCDFSPYTPVSRLMWNEFYLDILAVPELKHCPSAQTVLASSSAEIDFLRNLALVDYSRQMALKRRVLEELCRCCFANASGRLREIQNFSRTHPRVVDYARFRATAEKHGALWRNWSQSLRDGVIAEGDYDEYVVRYHVYVQWLAHQQMQGLTEKLRKRGVSLYLDLPLGVHPEGYDVWRENAVFARNVSAGAPPDTFFAKGQNWGFPPLHPEQIRKQGYRYVIDYLRHHLRHAGVLRIDHVMSFHRMFWVPAGFDAKDGVYVRYPADEFYAILALESNRHNSIVVGEDLGTVPPEVRATMDQHNVCRMYVAQFEFNTDSRGGINPVPHNAVAYVNTHDTPTFAAFWRGADIVEREKIGFLHREDAEIENQERQKLRLAVASSLRRQSWLRPDIDEGNVQAVIEALLSFLSASSARLVLVNLEDLWLEMQPQNLPGTQGECPNWRRKARYSFEAFSQMTPITNMLREIDRLRKAKS